MQFHEENSNIQSVQHIPTEDYGTSHNLIHGNPTNLSGNGSGQEGCILACKSVGTSSQATSSNGCSDSTTEASNNESALVPYLHNPASTTGTSLGFPPRDDLDLMLKHEDFPNILILATKIKQYREILFHAPKGQRIVLPGPVHKLMDKDDAQVLVAVARMQNQLLSPLCRQEMAGVVIRRGEYPLTDGTIDDALKSLEQEFDHVCKFVQRALNRQNNPATTGRGRKDSAAIAVKYSKWQTDLLMGWMIENVHHPFPSHDDIRDLMQSTGLSQSQVVNWTTNVRKRNRKATCENGKKPHHFIDFMFLAHYDNEEDRKKKERGELVQEQYGHLHSPCSSNCSDLTTNTTETKKAPSTSSRSNKKKGNKKADSPKMPPSPPQLSSVPVTPPALTSHHATTAVANHPQAGHHDHNYYRLHQQYNQYQHEHRPHGDPYHYHQEYEHFQQFQNHQPLQQQHYYHEGGMYTSPGQTLEPPRPNGDDDDYDHVSSSLADSHPLEDNSDHDHDDDRDDANSLVLAPDYHEGVQENNIDPDLFFATHDDDDDEHDEQEVQEVHRWGAIADSNTAELFSAMPFWGNEIGDDAMVLGGLSWLKGRGVGDVPSHLDRNDDDDDNNNVHDDNGDQEDNNDDDDAATATSADGEQPIVQQEQMYLCDWIPSILPTVTQDSSDFWLSIQAHGLNHTEHTQPLGPPLTGVDSSSSSSNNSTTGGGGGPKRGRINTIDVTNEFDNDNQEDETVQQWASALGVSMGI